MHLPRPEPGEWVGDYLTRIIMGDYDLDDGLTVSAVCAFYRDNYRRRRRPYQSPAILLAATVEYSGCSLLHLAPRVPELLISTAVETALRLRVNSRMGGGYAETDRIR